MNSPATQAEINMREDRLRAMAVQYPKCKPLELERLLKQEFRGKALPRFRLYAIVENERARARRKGKHLSAVRAPNISAGVRKEIEEKHVSNVVPAPQSPVLGQRAMELPEELKTALAEARKAFQDGLVICDETVKKLATLVEQMAKHGFDQAVMNGTQIKLRQPERFMSMDIEETKPEGNKPIEPVEPVAAPVE